MQEDVRVVAPFLLRYEVTSALRRKVVRGVMSYEDARHSIEEVLSLDIEPLDQPELSLRAFEIASHFSRPTAYDSYYLALAEMLECEFWTADENLQVNSSVFLMMELFFLKEKFGYNAIRGSFHNIRWLGDYQER
jgi:predicted nucleic acid-binding protein